MSLAAHARNARSIVRLLLLLTICLPFIVSGQTLDIKLIDGRNGRAIPNSCVNVWIGGAQKDALAIPSDKDGVAHLRLTSKDEEVDTQNHWKGCGAFGVINPVVKYEDFVEVNVGYVLCEPHGTDFSWLELKKIPTKQLMQTGVVTANACGKLAASPVPGELIIFVRPLNFWEKFKQ
jgi:hypothetical protein